MKLPLQETSVEWRELRMLHVKALIERLKMVYINGKKAKESLEKNEWK